MSAHPELEAEAAEALGPGPWWAKCTEPERPGDRWTFYSWECNGCFLGLVADARLEPEAVGTSHRPEVHFGTLTDCLEMATLHRQRHDLPTFGVTP